MQQALRVEILPADLAREVPISDALQEIGLVEGRVPPGDPQGTEAPLLAVGGGDPVTATGQRVNRPPSIYIGERLPPVPGKLVEKIRRWEFIEMHELLPELLANQKAEEGAEQPGGRKKPRRCILDVNAWLQCFAMFVGVVARESPEAVSELMAYMVHIIRA